MEVIVLERKRNYELEQNYITIRLSRTSVYVDEAIRSGLVVIYWLYSNFDSGQFAQMFMLIWEIAGRL